MLPFLKRKSEKAAAPLVPAWHPNFRNFERLPDTKVVRTSFFLNGFAVIVTLALLLFFAYREYSALILRQQIAAWDAQIARDRTASAKAVADFRKFQAEEKKVKEVETFLTGKLVLSDFILNLGKTLPHRIALQSINFRDTGVVIKGIVRGAGDRASGEVSEYVAKLQKDPAIGGLFSEITQTSLARDPQSGRMTFDLVMKFSTGAKK